MLDSIDLEQIVDISIEAGDAIMEIYEHGIEAEYKEDDSPLTQADIASNDIITTRLKELYPTLPILSEESQMVEYEIRKDWEYFWLIDPIDGTKEFIKKSGEFTVNIALIHQQTPLLGVVYAPALGDIYKAKQGEGAFKNNHKLPLADTPQEALRVVASKSHLSVETQDFIDRLTKKHQKIEQLSKGSSLKLVMVAEGLADIYPRLGSTMEWDTAAADAIVRESGKMSYIYNLEAMSDNRESLRYNKENLLNPWFVVK